jgi:hypothetical protein
LVDELHVGGIGEEELADDALSILSEGVAGDDIEKGEVSS